VIGKAGVMALPPCVLARHIHTHTRTHTLRLGFVRFPVDIFGIAPLRCLTLLVSLAIQDSVSGYNMGFAFVEYATAEMAEEATSLHLSLAGSPPPCTACSRC